jgi:hypothetical protein
MKPVHVLGLSCLVIVLILCAGCTSPPAQTVTTVTTTTPVKTMIATPVPTATPWPGAVALKTEVLFGTGGKNGSATVYKTDVRPEYTWTSPSFNSAREQRSAGEPLETQQGYNTEKPAEGNAFLFVSVRLANTGTTSIVAPSPNQFVVYYEGTAIPYSSLHGSDVIVGSMQGTQYDYLIGKGGVSGYIQPGDSNAADGFLIYEVPASIDLARTYMVITLDSGHESAWKLG